MIQQVAENLSSCDLTPNQARALKLKSVKFCIVDKLLYWKDLSGFFLRCLDKEESVQVMHHIFILHHHLSSCAFQSKNTMGTVPRDL